MDAATLLADPDAIRLECFISAAHSVTLVVQAAQRRPCCPKCGIGSTSLHSHYTRHVADLPWHGVSVRLELHTRKLRCRNELCQQKVFCERLPKVVAAYARKTVRLGDALTLLAFALGGEAGARTARKLNLTVSGDTLLRRIRRHALSEAASPKVLGVDDWAKRKGQVYGTILVDLERHRPIDLLPDREAETFGAWLKKHSGVEIISRDRGGKYADGARTGAPAAVQIADRWHLLKNASEMLERLLQRHHRAIRVAVGRSDDVTVAASDAPAPEAVCVTPETATKSDLAPAINKKQTLRRALFAEVKALQATGLNINQVRLRLNCHHTTAAHFFGADVYPSIERTRGSRLTAKFAEHARRRWAEGCDNSQQLFRELRGLGYRGSAPTLRRLTQGWREPGIHIEPLPKLPTARSLLWLLRREREKLREDERRVVEGLLDAEPEIKTGYELAEEFRRMICDKDAVKLTDWLERAARCGIRELVNFVVGIRRDEAAVRAALTHEWSQGQVEGQINRLKLLKRQMYGRAKLDLLRARVLHAA